jgi:hypothetical protein
VSAGAASPILHQVLYVQSENIKHLSTSKIFSWATGLGAGLMGKLSRNLREAYADYGRN